MAAGYSVLLRIKKVFQGLGEALYAVWMLLLVALMFVGPIVLIGWAAEGAVRRLEGRPIVIVVRSEK